MVSEKLAMESGVTLWKWMMMHGNGWDACMLSSDVVHGLDMQFDMGLLRCRTHHAQTWPGVLICSEVARL